MARNAPRSRLSRALFTRPRRESLGFPHSRVIPPANLPRLVPLQRNSSPSSFSFFPNGRENRCTMPVTILCLARVWERSRSCGRTSRGKSRFFFFRVRAERTRVRVCTWHARSRDPVFLIHRRARLSNFAGPGIGCRNQISDSARVEGQLQLVSALVELIDLERTLSALTSCHARREYFVPKIAIFSQLYPSTDETNNKFIASRSFLSSDTDEFERKRKRRIVVYGSVTRQRKWSRES